MLKVGLVICPKCSRASVGEGRVYDLWSSGLDPEWGWHERWLSQLSLCHFQSTWHCTQCQIASSQCHPRGPLSVHLCLYAYNGRYLLQCYYHQKLAMWKFMLWNMCFEHITFFPLYQCLAQSPIVLFHHLLVCPNTNPKFVQPVPWCCR